MKRITALLTGTILAALLTTACLSSAASAFVPAGSGSWFWQNPLPQGDTLNAVRFVDPSHGWAVGDMGTIFATSDGGSNWYPQRSGTSNFLYGLTFSDANHGWASGASPGGPCLLITSDGGAHWTQQGTNMTGGSLVGVSCVGQSLCWAVASDGTVDATTNGGSVWGNLGQPAYPSTLSAVTFVNAQDGWAVGDVWGRSGLGSVVATTDGGAHWTMQGSRATSNLLGVSFSGTSDGWAVGDGGAIVATTDGGANWNPQVSQTNVDLFAVSFVDSDRGWAVGRAGTILATTDGGANWTVQDSGTDSELHSVSFVNASDGWAVGVGGTIVATTDGGLHWHAQSLGTRERLASVSFFGQSDGWAVGAAGTILVTTDGGTDWSAQAPATTADLTGVSFPDFANGWAVGITHDSNGVENGNVILATSDGGNIWSSQTPFTGAALTGVSFVDADHGWAVGGQGQIGATGDGGAHWTLQNSGTNSDLTAVCFANASEGCAVGADGTILFTNDGGAQWHLQNHGAATLSAIAYGDAGHAWIVGAGGLILASNDGGAQWSPQTSGSSYDLHGVSFVDAVHGSVVGYHGTILATSDGGTNWTTQSSGTTNSLSSASFVDTSHGWAVGEFGNILAVDTTAPTSSVSGLPVGWTSHSVTLNFSAADDQSGVAYTEYQVAGGGWTLGNSVTVSAPGTTTVSYRSVDAVGNVETTKTCQVRIDLSAPVTTAAGLPPGWTNHPVTLTFSTNDDQSGVAYTEYQVAGGVWTPGASVTVSAPGTTTVSYRSVDAVGNVETTKTCQVRIDVAAPVTTAAGLPPGWTNHPVTLAFSTSVDQSGIAYTEYEVAAGGAWTPGASVTVSTPGTTTVSYRSADAAGNVEPIKSCEVHIDTSRPVLSAYSTTASKGHRAKLRFRIADAVPSCGEANVTIAIKHAGRIVKTIKIGDAATNQPLSTSFRCHLARGSYALSLTATDVAGNTSKAVSAKLAVK